MFSSQNKSYALRHGTEIWNEAERRIQEYFDAHLYGWDRVDQSIASFARIYQGRVKRPDYIVYLDTYTKIIVDAKDWTLDAEFRNFHIDEGDARRAAEWERQHGSKLWLAISNEHSDYKTWYYISISRILEVCPLRTSRKSGNFFRTFTILDCVTIGPEDSLSKLFRKI
ncbi:MAG: hypothetical protein RBG13Loki_0473 [Promethearchaeota archaeon CR_4]|nr:MAG: hypothetical protein RBG13Loki_0473 [Candidatus Lokiarchaeota archaeon CR_4]